MKFIFEEGLYVRGKGPGSIPPVKNISQVADEDFKVLNLESCCLGEGAILTELDQISNFRQFHI